MVDLLARINVIELKRSACSTLLAAGAAGANAFIAPRGYPSSLICSSLLWIPVGHGFSLPCSTRGESPDVASGSGGGGGGVATLTFTLALQDGERSESSL